MDRGGGSVKVVKAAGGIDEGFMLLNARTKNKMRSSQSSLSSLCGLLDQPAHVSFR